MIDVLMWYNVVKLKVVLLSDALVLSGSLLCILLK